ncbi:protein cycle-like [Ctenocephalides felis]|nr:protein cycle-like [Ctenocephalides felis]
MNALLKELSQLVSGGNQSRGRSDKLGVLRRAVFRVRCAQNSKHGTNTGEAANTELVNRWKPSDIDIKALGQKIPEQCFLFAVGCSRGKILYTSTSIANVLRYKQSELVSHSWFDVLHPKDVPKVKEQLSVLDLTDAKCLYSDTFRTFFPGARRSFCCRMRVKTTSILNDDADTSTDDPRLPFEERRFIALQCYGYLKSTNNSEPCLVASARPMPAKVVSSDSYASRHGVDGRCLYVEPLYGLVFGQLPQEMEGSTNDKHLMVPGVKLKAFKNPWTRDTEFMVARYSTESA